MDQKQFQKIIDEKNPKVPYFMNILKAFIVGGVICTIGQLITFFLYAIFPFYRRNSC